MTVAYSSEIPDNLFEDKLESTKIRINCVTQTTTRISLLPWVFKIKAEGKQQLTSLNISF